MCLWTTFALSPGNWGEGVYAGDAVVAQVLTGFEWAALTGLLFLPLLIC